MPGSSSVTDSPYPFGRGLVHVRVGGYVPNGITGFVIDTFVLPWDCYVEEVYLSYQSTHATADLDAVALNTVDGPLSIVAAANMSADVAGVKQTLAAAIVGVALVKGDKIQAVGDSTEADEQGMVVFTVGLRPKFTTSPG